MHTANHTIKLSALNRPTTDQPAANFALWRLKHVQQSWHTTHTDDGWQCTLCVSDDCTLCVCVDSVHCVSLLTVCVVCLSRQCMLCDTDVSRCWDWINVCNMMRPSRRSDHEPLDRLERMSDCSNTHQYVHCQQRHTTHTVNTDTKFTLSTQTHNVHCQQRHTTLSINSS